MWLGRLSDTKDYQKGGEFQKGFARKVLGYLQAAEEKEQFREALFAIIAGAAETCGDRIALSILNVSTAFKLAAIDTKNIQEFVNLLIKEVWPLQMLEEIARDKVPCLPFCDVIEVYLGYPIMLKDRLKMPIDVEDMLYFRCSSLTQKDLDSAAEFVLQKQNDDEAKCRFLASQEKWIQYLKDNYPVEFENIEREIGEAEEDCASANDYEKLGKTREEKLIAITAWALACRPR